MADISPNPWLESVEDGLFNFSLFDPLKGFVSAQDPFNGIRSF